MKALKIILIILIIAFVVWYFVFRKRKKSVNPPNTSAITGSPSGTGTGADNTPLNFNRILNQGSTGPEVEAIQIILVKALNKNIAIDGVLGPQTAGVIEDFDQLPTSLGALWSNYLQDVWPRPASLTLAQVRQAYL